MATMYLDKKPENRNKERICPDCGAGNAFMFDAHGKIWQCRECGARWNFGYAQEVPDQKYLEFIGYDSEEQGDPDRSKLFKLMTKKEREKLETIEIKALDLEEQIADRLAEIGLSDHQIRGIFQETDESKNGGLHYIASIRMRCQDIGADEIEMIRKKDGSLERRGD